MKQKKWVTALNGYEMDTDLDTLIGRLQTLRAEHGNVTLDLEVDYEDREVKLTYNREETDLEYSERLIKDKAEQDAQLQRDHDAYLKLKARLGL